MGMSMSFYFLRGGELSDVQIREGLSRNKSWMDAERQEKYAMFTSFSDGESPLFPDILNLIHAGAELFVTKSDSSKWLSYYYSELCESYTAANRDVSALSETFQTAVAAFSVFDSDTAAVFYCDSETGVFQKSIYYFGI